MFRRLFILILRGYQLVVSPFLGNRCRFYPSCSEYMIIAVRRFGVFKGTMMGFKRLGRCHPLCEGGFDPVPELSSPTQSKEPESEAKH